MYNLYMKLSPQKPRFVLFFWDLMRTMLCKALNAYFWTIHSICFLSLTSWLMLFSIWYPSTDYTVSARGGITRNNVAWTSLSFWSFSSIIGIFIMITIIYMSQKCICSSPIRLTVTVIFFSLSGPEVTVSFPILAISMGSSNICNSFSTFSEPHIILGHSRYLVNIYLLAYSPLVSREQWNLTIFFMKHEVRKNRIPK